MSRSRYKSKSKRGGWGNIKAIVLLGGALVITMAFLVIGQSKPEIRRGEDLCRTDAALPAIAVWQIDATEILKPDEAARVATAVRRSAERLPVEGKLVVSVLQPDGKRNAQVLFERCKPRTGAHANGLYENGRLLEQHYREAFTEPLEAVLNGLADLGNADSSPIAEWLYEVSTLFERPAGAKLLFVVSDMLQFSNDMSMYRPYGWQNLLHLPKVRAMQGRLQGVEVSVLLRLHERSASLQGDKHERCWQSYFDYAGAQEFQIRPL